MAGKIIIFVLFVVLLYTRVYSPNTFMFLLYSELAFSSTTVYGIMRFVAPSFEGEAFSQVIMILMSGNFMILVYRL